VPGKALLVMHSPLDTTVDIAEAEKIYSAARHPKSFVSLDSADHLLSDKRDARYAAEVIAAWAGRYLPAPASRAVGEPLAQGHVRVEEISPPFTNRVTTDGHNWLADEPRALGGNDSGPDPYEHLLAGLGACTSMTLRMYAERKGWPLDQVSVTLFHSRDHRADCEHCEDPHAAMELIERRVRLRGALSDEQVQRLLEIANKCPVHRTLHGPLAIHTLLAEDQNV
jgi:putative redox protein